MSEKEPILSKSDKKDIEGHLPEINYDDAANNSQLVAKFALEKLNIDSNEQLFTGGPEELKSPEEWKDQYEAVGNYWAKNILDNAEKKFEWLKGMNYLEADDTDRMDGIRNNIGGLAKAIGYVAHEQRIARDKETIRVREYGTEEEKHDYDLFRGYKCVIDGLEDGFSRDSKVSSSLIEAYDKAGLQKYCDSDWIPHNVDTVEMDGVVTVPEWKGGGVESKQIWPVVAEAN